MSAPYNLTNLTNAESMNDILVATDALSGNHLVIIIIIAIWVIAFVALKNYDNKTAFVGSTFGTTVLAIIINSMVPVNNYLMTTLFISLAIAVAAMFLTSDSGI